MDGADQQWCEIGRPRAARVHRARECFPRADKARWPDVSGASDVRPAMQAIGGTFMGAVWCCGLLVG